MNDSPDGDTTADTTADATADAPFDAPVAPTADSPSTLLPARSIFTASLSLVQVLAGLTASLVSIGGSAVMLSNYLESPATPGTGHVVTVIHDGKSRRAVGNATIEILNPQDFLITSGVSNAAGEVHHSLREGPYRIRINHPGYASEMRHIRIVNGQTATIRLSLTTVKPSVAPAASPAAAPSPVVPPPLQQRPLEQIPNQSS
jgi:Carboxypeptidase regulatory-like domain